MTDDRAREVYAKAGLMIRNGLQPDAKHVIFDTTPSGVTEFMDRATTGGSTVYNNGMASSAIDTTAPQSTTTTTDTTTTTSDTTTHRRMRKD